MESLFDHASEDAHRDGLLARVSAFIAPVAADASAVVDDAEALDLADAVYEAFGDLTKGGLSRANLLRPAQMCVRIRRSTLASISTAALHADACSQQSSPAAVRLQPHGGRRTDGVRTPRTRRGVQAILVLLDRTRAGLRSGMVTREQVKHALAQARRGFAVNADHLNRLATSAPLEELLRERRNHRSEETLLTDAEELITLVVQRFPALAPDGDRLVREAMRYSRVVQSFIGRVLDEATAHRTSRCSTPSSTSLRL